MGKTIVRKFADPSRVDSNSVLKVDEFLTNVVVGVRDNQMVMGNLLPEQGVRKDTDKIQVRSPKGFFKTVSRRKETALPEQGALQFSEDTYLCEEFAMEGWVSDDAIRNAIVQLDPLSQEAEFLTKRIILTQELAIITEIFQAIKAAGATHYDILAADTKWNGGANSVPLTNISTAIKAIASRVGRRPNLVSLSTDVYEAFINNSQVIDVLKRSSQQVVESATPVSTIRGMGLQIADAIANEGTLDSPTYRNIQYDVATTTQLKDTVIVGYIEGNDPLTLGKTFVSKPLISFRGRGLEGDRRQATLVYVAKKFGPKVTNVGAAHIIAKVLG